MCSAEPPFCRTTIDALPHRGVGMLSLHSGKESGRHCCGYLFTERWTLKGPASALDFHEAHVPHFRPEVICTLTHLPVVSQ